MYLVYLLILSTPMLYYYCQQVVMKFSHWVFRYKRQLADLFPFFFFGVQYKMKGRDIKIIKRKDLAIYIRKIKSSEKIFLL